MNLSQKKEPKILTFDIFKNHKELIHLVTQKSSNHSYEFSLALHTNQDKKSIIKNRNILSNTILKNKNFTYIVANQTHSDNIKIIDKKINKGWEQIDDAIENCDALITNKKDIMLTILTADCVPILLYDKEKQVISAIHAGWKGTQKKIVSKTIKKMSEVYNTNPKDIIALIAPSIGKCCYEVGVEVAQNFFHKPKSYTKIKDKYMLDLPYINQQQMINSGIKKENIELSNICTSCSVDKFFSYRKESGCSGRFMSIIGLKGN